MAETKLQAMCYIPMPVAVLCQDCSCISNGVLACPACGSKSIASVAPWLQREGSSENQTEVQTESEVGREEGSTPADNQPIR